MLMIVGQISSPGEANEIEYIMIEPLRYIFILLSYIRYL